ncbi:excisionase family DNA-binding protein [Brucepastera parasyntrophica]|uniref:excisionase family DNA-binding protein n=1 Tax=Brucepastera parasyntrophica TaxID=2880008 RepID=UPI0034E1E051|nr:excisionase family DNA-binding protein [Brucepastera parasyntrophica]
MISAVTVTKIQTLPAIVSTKEAADFFSVHYLTILRLIMRKELPAYKDCDGQWCISRQDIKAFCSRQSNL